ncbi:hypothetical protein [Thermofilum sp.]|uniref:hypothetical protein n=1 Tax=Thermofilum sp. TaxID=1961369 RepID=UPI00319E50EF
MFAFRAWVSTQQQRMGSIDMATASYSIQYNTTSGNAVISLLVRNNLPSQVNVTDINIVLSSGTVLTRTSPSVMVAPSLSSPVTVNAKSDALFTVMITGLTSGTTVREVSVQVTDPSTGQSQWIKAVGG